jgi:hypothetical protein
MSPRQRRRRFRSAALLLALLSGIAVGTQGCAAVAVGYLIGDGIARSDKAKACRQNLQTVNADRLAHGKDAFPDQCGS